MESLVFYMYRWSFSKNPSFPHNANYIAQLSQLLPPDNPMREYILSELEFAVLLSTPNEPVNYPIVTESAFPRVVDVQYILKFVDS